MPSTLSILPRRWLHYPLRWEQSAPLPGGTKPLISPIGILVASEPEQYVASPAPAHSNFTTLKKRVKKPPRFHEKLHRACEVERPTESVQLCECPLSVVSKCAKMAMRFSFDLALGVEAGDQLSPVVSQGSGDPCEISGY